MRIEETGADAVRPGSVRKLREENAPAPDGPTRPASDARRADRVEISDAGRALAAEASSVAETESSLSPEDVAAFRERIDDGVYDSDPVVEHVANRLIDEFEV